MKPKFPTAKDGVIRIADDHWWLVALVLVSAGGGVTVLGLLPHLGWNATPPIPQALLVGGLVALCLGAWILYQSAEIVIDPSESTVTIRTPIHERHFSFSDVSYIELQPSRPPLALAGLPPFPEGLYDVVLCLAHSDLRLHVGLELSTARMKAKLLADATGRSVIRS